jgi:transcriptional regulator with XRE-family HTH domain
MAALIKQVGKRIKQVRKAAKLTQERLAEKTGLSIEFISRIERGVAQPSFKTLEIMAQVLSVDAKDLFDFKQRVLLKDKKQEARQKKEYVDTITAALKEMEICDLLVIYNVMKALEPVAQIKFVV